MKRLINLTNVLLLLSIFALVLMGCWYAYAFYMYGLGIYGTAAYIWGTVTSWLRSVGSFFAELFR